MADAQDVKRDGLEEEYSRLELLREKIRVAQEAKASGISTMLCPRCGGNLKESDFEEVLIDTCESCGGIWLDSGELEQLISRESGGWFSRLWFAEG